MKKADAEAKTERLLIAARKGYLFAQLDLGLTYVNEEKWEEAYFWLSLTEENGDFGVSAHLTPEQIEAVDKRVQEWEPEPDPEAIAFLAALKSKAEDGDVQAQFDLAEKYKQGIEKHSKAAGQGDLERDLTSALDWWRKAAEQGHAGAQFQLGEAFSKGLGARPDYAEAVKWYGKAAAQGYEVAQDNLDLLSAHGYGEPKDE